MGVTPSERSGRTVVLAVIVVTLTISLATTSAYVITIGTERLFPQVVRLLLEVGLCVLLYRRVSWARWLGGLLFSVASLVSLLAAIEGTGFVRWIPLVLGLVFAACGLALLFSPAVRSYFRPAGAAT